MSVNETYARLHWWLTANYPLLDLTTDFRWPHVPKTNDGMVWYDSGVAAPSIAYLKSLPLTETDLRTEYNKFLDAQEGIRVDKIMDNHDVYRVVMRLAADVYPNDSQAAIKHRLARVIRKK